MASSGGLRGPPVSASHTVVMKHVLHPQPGYPFTLGLSIEYALSEHGLAVRVTATNLGPTACPYGAGAHPYLRVGGASIDDAILRLPARSVLRSDEAAFPSAWSPSTERCTTSAGRGRSRRDRP